MELPLRNILAEHGKTNTHSPEIFAQKTGLGPESDRA
jgi:hypothetical protein